MKFIFGSFLLVLSTIQSFSQAGDSELPQQEWRLIGGMSNAKSFYGSRIDFEPLKSSYYDFNVSKVMLSATEAVGLCSIEKDEYGVVQLNSKMQNKWLTAVKGLPLTITKFYDKLLVITVPGNIEDDALTLDASIIDAKTGKIISTKNIYKHNNSYKSEPKFFFDPASNRYLIGIRQTEIDGSEKKGNIVEMRKKASLTSAFQLLTLDEKADIVKSIKVPVSNYSYFINCGLSKRGDLYWVTNDDELIYTVEKLNLVGEKANNKINVNLGAEKKRTPAIAFSISNNNPDVIYLAAGFDNENKEHVTGTYKLNFSDSKVLRNETVYNKEFKNSMKDNYEEINKDIDNPSTKFWDDMEPAAILEEGNRVIVYNEIGGTGSINMISYTNGKVGSSPGATRYSSRDALITFYDNDLKPINTQIFPKFSECFAPVGVGSSFHFANNKLHILSNDLDGLASYKPIYGIFDLSSGKAVKMVHVTK
ncbi:MAG: hypothetical protein JWQ09_6065, partial [Segetibacter sp.]|nr:hypothetical protein [Segetibacter sp.]